MTTDGRATQSKTNTADFHGWDRLSHATSLRSHRAFPGTKPAYNFLFSFSLC